jgi:diguanylate cyclase (GGDEF)-like protein
MKRASPAWSACLSLALLLAAGTASASAEVAALLLEAESVRSTDPARFGELLGQLNAEVGDATPAQREQIAYLKAYELAYRGRFDLAIQAADRLFRSSSDVKMRFRAGALMANSYAATRDFIEGLRYLDETLAMIDEIQDRELRHHGLSAAAILYNQLGQYELGLIYSERILADEPNERTHCFAARFRLEALLALERLPAGDDTIREIIDDCESQGETIIANQARMHLVRRWHAMGRRADALAEMESHLTEVEGLRYSRLIAEFHSLLAELNIARGDLERADLHAQVAIRNSSGINYSLPLVTAYRVLYETAMQRGDTAMALEQYRNYAEADRAYLDDIKARELAVQLAQHETLQKNQTIQLLNRQNQVLQLEQRVAQQAARNTQLLIILLSVLLAFIAYFAWKTKKMQVSFRRLAETDTLTGISNRHHFSRRAEEVLLQCKRSGEAAALVMFDLDEFKAINDRYGHAVGDWVLGRVAVACRGACRHGDLFGRIGGEEFAFLLPAAGGDAGAKLAQECRDRLAGIDTAPTGHAFRVTASFGVVDTVTAGHDFHHLLARADEAMYRAKRDGRDRVELLAPA